MHAPTTGGGEVAATDAVPTAHTVSPEVDTASVGPAPEPSVEPDHAPTSAPTVHEREQQARTAAHVARVLRREGNRAARAAAESAEAWPGPDVTVRTSSPPPLRPAAGEPTNLWEHQAEQRRQVRAATNLDVGLQPIALPVLAPIVEMVESGRFSGREIFTSFAATQPARKAAVTHLRMSTGSLMTRTLDEKKVLSAVLSQARAKGYDDNRLAEIVQLTIDHDARALVWGLASHDAAAALAMVPFQIPTRDGPKTLAMEYTHALDGYYVEFDGLNISNEELGYLWDLLGACGAMPVAGQYTSVSALTGTTGSRYRLSFLDSGVPAVFKKDGRLLDEVIFLGRLFTVYPKGWFRRQDDRRRNRANFDAYARDYKVLTPEQYAKRQQSQVDRQAKAAATATHKRQRVDDDAAPTPTEAWTVVTKGAAANAAGQLRPWTSANSFGCLADQFVVSTSTLTSPSGGDVMVVPNFVRRTDAAPIRASGYVGGTKVKGRKTVRAELTLQAACDEVAQIHALAAAQAQTFAVACTEADANASLDLAGSITRGNVDALQFGLMHDPIAFRRQLETLAELEPTLLRALVQLYAMNRWFRCVFGGTEAFAKIYKHVFGHEFSLTALTPDYTALTSTYSPDVAMVGGEDDESWSPMWDEVLSLGELVLGSLAPGFYQNDMALYMLSNAPVFSVPAWSDVAEHRSLASSSVKAALWGDSLLGSTVRTYMAKILRNAQATAMDQAADSIADHVDADVTTAALGSLLDTLHQLDALDAAGCLDMLPSNQVLYSEETRQLEHGNLEELWVDAVADTHTC